MKKKPATLPRGFRTLTPSLAVSDVQQAINFYVQAFDAEVQAVDSSENTRFASVRIGNSMVFVTQAPVLPGYMSGIQSCAAPVSTHMYVQDADAVFQVAILNGASEISAPVDTYWGERSGILVDPFGHMWSVATRVENLTREELEERRAIAEGRIMPAVAEVPAPVELPAAEETAPTLKLVSGESTVAA